MFRVVSAHTTNPNTPESDKLPRVMHTVSIRFDGETEMKEVQLMAADPLDAMDRVRLMDQEHLLKIARPEQ